MRYLVLLAAVVFCSWVASAEDKGAANLSFVVLKPKAYGCTTTSPTEANQQTTQSSKPPLERPTSDEGQAQQSSTTSKAESKGVDILKTEAAGTKSGKARQPASVSSNTEPQVANKITGESRVISSIGATSAAKYSSSADSQQKVLPDSCLLPLRNASVILHPVSKSGRQERGGLELKTNAEGQAQIGSISYGRLRVQVIAPGFQTYGEDFNINQPEQTIRIVVQRPKEQYSIYK